jgi:hypothetical protein
MVLVLGVSRILENQSRMTRARRSVSVRPRRCTSAPEHAQLHFSATSPLTFQIPRHLSKSRLPQRWRIRSDPGDIFPSALCPRHRSAGLALCFWPAMRLVRSCFADQVCLTMHLPVPQSVSNLPDDKPAREQRDSPETKIQVHPSNLGHDWHAVQSVLLAVSFGSLQAPASETHADSLRS